MQLRKVRLLLWMLVAAAAFVGFSGRALAASEAVNDPSPSAKGQTSDSVVNTKTKEVINEVVNNSESNGVVVTKSEPTAASQSYNHDSELGAKPDPAVQQAVVSPQLDNAKEQADLTTSKNQFEKSTKKYNSIQKLTSPADDVSNSDISGLGSLTQPPSTPSAPAPTNSSTPLGSLLTIFGSALVSASANSINQILNHAVGWRGIDKPMLGIANFLLVIVASIFLLSFALYCLRKSGFLHAARSDSGEANRFPSSFFAKESFVHLYKHKNQSSLFDVCFQNKITNQLTNKEIQK